MQPAEGSQLTPIPLDEAVSSLSAILLNEVYYAFIMAGRREVDGLPWGEPPVPKRAFIGAGKSHLGFDTMSFQLIHERFFNGPGRSSGPSGAVPAA
jgi:hypothetical protein